MSSAPARKRRAYTRAADQRRVATSPAFSSIAALSNRVLELTPDGIHQYGGGYTEYVARTGQEAPGLHPG